MIDTALVRKRSPGQKWCFAAACPPCAGLLLFTYSNYFHNSLRIRPGSHHPRNNLSLVQEEAASRETSL